MLTNVDMKKHWKTTLDVVISTKKWYNREVKTYGKRRYLHHLKWQKNFHR